MAIYDSFKSVPEQMLEVLKATQDIILTTASSVVETTNALTPVMPANPLAGPWAELIKVTGAAFTFSEKVLVSQKDFTIKLLETYLPTKASSKSV